MYYGYYYFMMLMILMMIFIFMNNFLMFLISLEYMLMYLLMLSLTNIEIKSWLFLYLLVMGVCESVIGISLMVSLVHSYGNQNMKILNLKW